MLYINLFKCKNLVVNIRDSETREGQENMRVEIDKEIKQQYNVEQVADYDGTINIVLKLKRRTCKACKKEFESKGGEFLIWRTKESHSINGWFCRRHYVQARKLLNELR